MAHARGRDKRPLLLVRETTEKEAKLAQKLAKALNGERVQLASKWFNCINVGGDVSSRDNTYHDLFGKGRHVMVVSTWDGKKVVPVTRLSESGLWKAMSTVAKRAYSKSPDAAVKRWVKLLSKFDALDDKETLLKKQLAEGEAKKNRSKVKLAQSRLAKLQKEREKVFATETKLKDLALKPVAAEDE